MGVCRGDGGGVAMGFGLGMFFVVVVVASICDLGFGIYYFNVLYCKIKVEMLRIL